MCRHGLIGLLAAVIMSAPAAAAGLEFVTVPADAGFVVAALNHPGDTALDKSLYYDLSIYMQRPLERVIDCLIGASPLATTIDPNRIGIYGFSRGGYTALVAIGANTDFALGLTLCEGRTDKIFMAARASAFIAQGGHAY